MTGHRSLLAIAVSLRACLAGHRVAFATATEWVARLAEAKRHNHLDAELRRLSFIPLLVVDEVGYIPFDPEAANLIVLAGVRTLRTRFADERGEQFDADVDGDRSDP